MASPQYVSECCILRICGRQCFNSTIDYSITSLSKYFCSQEIMKKENILKYFGSQEIMKEENQSDLKNTK